MFVTKYNHSRSDVGFKNTHFKSLSAGGSNTVERPVIRC